MVLDMLDVEKVKTLLQAELDEREKAKAKLEKYRSSENKAREELYEKLYNMYRFRFDGMCDMLYDLGYLAWAWSNDDKTVVFVEKRVDGETFSLVDEIPF